MQRATMSPTVSALLVCLSLFLAACGTTGGGAGGGSSAGTGPSIGPSLEPDEQEQKQEQQQNAPEGIVLDVIVPVFDPGLPEDSDDYEKKNIWPELRRAEAKKFALNMKHALEDTGTFGAVRVAPDSTATGELYVLGTIEKADGENVAIHVEVRDVAGKLLLDQSYKHRVKEAFFRDQRNKGKDPYAPVFEKAAEKIAKLIKKKKEADIAELRSIADMRFASVFVEDAFGQYLRNKNGITRLKALPADDDPLLVKTKAVRVREGLFIDEMQNHYEEFENNMDASYTVWQKESFTEIKAARKAKTRAAGLTIFGALLTAASVYAGTKSGNDLEATAATAGVIAGASLLAKSFGVRGELKVHREALAELGQSVDVELGPQVISFEDQTVELTGKAKEQFKQWRAFLQRIYAEETTPVKQL